MHKEPSPPMSLGAQAQPKNGSHTLTRYPDTDPRNNNKQRGPRPVLNF